MPSENGEVLRVDEAYVRWRSRRGVVVCTLTIWCLWAAGLAGEFIAPAAIGNVRPTLRGEFGDRGAIFCMLAVPLVGSVVMITLGPLRMRALYRQRYVHASADGVHVRFGGTRVFPTDAANEVILKRDAARRAWIIASGDGKRRSLALPMAAFPTLDRFLQSNVRKLTLR